MMKEHRHTVHLSPEDHLRLRELRAQKPARFDLSQVQVPTRGALLADWVATTMGSWPFIIIQTVMLGVWIILNLTVSSSSGTRTPSYCSIWPYPSRRPMQRRSS